MIDVDALLAKIDMVAVVGRYVDLRKQGVEYVGRCPFHEERTASFTCNPKKGFTHCFGCGAHHDLIGFVMAVTQCGFMDACAQLGADAAVLKPARVQQRAMRDRVDELWVPIYPVPASAPLMEVDRECRIWNPKRNGWWHLAPQRADAYRDAEGRVMGYVLRTEIAGEKITPQVTWCVGPRGDQRWCLWPFPKPRPLFGLHELARKPSAPVLVVEGEKCAAAGAGALPQYAVITWAGGGKGVKYADFAPLALRDVVLWPDADPQGWAAMLGEVTGDGRCIDGVAQYAVAAGARSVRAVDTRGMPKGWDIADALWVDRWTPKQLASWAAARVRAVEISHEARAA